jgi:hypothetical protein
MSSLIFPRVTSGKFLFVTSFIRYRGFGFQVLGFWQVGGFHVGFRVSGSGRNWFHVGFRASGLAPGA